MDADRWETVQRLFNEAVVKASEDRDAFLGEACGADAELRAEVESLLKAHFADESFEGSEHSWHNTRLDLAVDDPKPNPEIAALLKEYGSKTAAAVIASG